MAVRKAGDSLLKQAYLTALAKEGRPPGALGADGALLEAVLADQGSAALGSQDLRELLLGAASPRKTAEMTTAEKLGLVERYLQDSMGSGAPVLLPVQDRAGVYGASVIDGDRMVVHGLSRETETPFGDGGDLAFAPAAAPGLMHVVESEYPVLAAPGGDPIATYAGVMSNDTARKIYGAARAEGFTRSDGLLEDWAMGRGIAPESGPVVQRLFQKLQQGQPAMNQQQSQPFQIVASRGSGAQYDVLGMREGIRNMGNARLPGEPGWLGNPYKAVDAGGQYTRQEATDLFGQLVEQKAQDPAWRDAFLALQGKRVGYYKPDEQVIHLHALQDWIARNTRGN